MNNKGKIEMTKNSPYMVSGCDIIDEEGNIITTPENFSLCRCGESSKKPFCDGTHLKNGFDGTPEDPACYKSKDYSCNAITVHFNSYLCRHAEACIKNCPEVFNPKNRPWINVEGCDVEKLINTIKKCPSGALDYTLDGIKYNKFHKDKRIIIEKNGPLNIQGEIELSDDFDSKDCLESKDHYCLCRCGKSKRKPFCDGEHNNLHS